MNDVAFTAYLEPSFPPLAWWARIDRSVGAVIVTHGRSVEVRSRFWIEGCWAGPFEKGDFDRTECIVGSGGVVREDGVVLVPSCATTDGLWYLENGSRVDAANSLSLLLAVVEDRLDPALEYHTESIVNGINSYVKDIPTQRGSVRALFMRNLSVLDRGCVETDKPLPPPFPQFAAYERYLEDRCGQMLANARSQARREPMDVFSTQSRGYDTTAVNALAAPFGIDRAFTCPESKAGQNDDGRAICDLLGVPCTAIDRARYKRHFPEEALYYACQAGVQDANLVEIHQYVRRPTVLLTGTFGEIWYGANLYRTLPGFINAELRRFSAGGHGMSEIRLDVGFVQLPVPFLGAQRRAEIFDITNGPEMDAWRVNPAYDRPIPRRIAERRAIPRAAFGQAKMASVTTFMRPALPQEPALRKAFLDTVPRWRRWVWPLVQRVNEIIRRQPRALYLFERLWARVTGHPEFCCQLLWGRFTGAVFCFCANRRADEYASWIGTRISSSTPPGEDQPWPPPPVTISNRPRIDRDL